MDTLLSPPFLSLAITWRDLLRKNFVQWEKLADFLELDKEQRERILKKTDFPLNLPLRLARKIKKSTLNDPILKQFLPSLDELEKSEGFVLDPVADSHSCKTDKLLHKYSGRVLLVCTSACAMHCRYCFRKNFNYDTTGSLFDAEISLIAQDPSIHEVILSGGDPLSLSDRVLSQLTQALGRIPHVKRIRFHTRFPIGIPERIDTQFLHLLSSIPCQVIFVIHSNHADELDEEVLGALQNIQKLGITVLNQSVLLRDVNDTVEVLETLCNKLVDHGIIPYYLHQLDRVSGASHFEVSPEKGLWLVAELSKRLSGYAVPKYVQEIAGEPNKINLCDV